jgi:hypothetical protein
MFNCRFSIFSCAVAIPPQIENATSTGSFNRWRSEILGPSKCVPGGIRTPNLLIRSFVVALIRSVLYRSQLFRLLR